jgi:iron complex outermembrane recepter protein
MSLRTCTRIYPYLSRKHEWRLLAAATLIMASCLARVADAQQMPATEVTNLKQLSLEDLMQTEVTSVSRRPETLLDVASAIQVVTDDQIERSGAQTLPEALELAGNLDIAQKDPHDWAISARGFNSNLGDKMLVLIDGRTVYTPLFSGVFWNAQDYLMKDVDRIEVISGPGGTVWGANAVNGVISVTTKSAEETQGAYVETGGGTGMEDFAGLRFGGKLAQNVFYRVYGKYFSVADGQLDDGGVANDSWKQGQGGFRIDDVQSAKNVITFQGDFYSSDENIESGGNARIAGGNLLGRWTDTLSNGSDVSLQLYYDRTHLSDPFAASPFDPAGLLVDNLDTYDLDFQDHMLMGEHNQVVWGLGYRFTHDDVVHEAPNFGFQPPVQDRNLFSVFGQDEVELQPSLFLTLGTKVEHNDYTGVEFEPNVRLRWEPAANQTFWGAISRAVRTPSRLDRDLAEPSPPKTLIEGGENFVSETLIAYELGYRVEINAKAAASVSAFYNDYDRLRSLGITPVTTLPLVYENNLAGRTYGAEFSGTYEAASWFRLRASYDILEEHIWVRPGRVDFEQALDETEDPKFQYSIHSSVDVTSRVKWDTDLRFVDTLRVNNGGVAGTVPSYTELGTRLAWRVSSELEVSLVGQNLLHAYHAEYGPPGPDREEVQRAIFGKLAWEF